ncbi:MAG: secretin and TonB N-terminal domain-containing protein [Planctomycetota bacterium]|nr:secretin and TonB N-terminal domain-containing protein [Planctomycetota bacterium]
MVSRHAHLGRWLAAVAAALVYLFLGAAEVCGASAPAPAPAGAAKSSPAKSDSAKTEVKPVAEKKEPPKAAPAAPEATKAEPAAPEIPTPGGGLDASVTANGKIESLHVKNEDLANVLELLSRQYHLNIIASKSVKGKVTADLYNVSIDQVLDAICRSNGLQWSREENSVYLCTEEEGKATRTNESRMVTEVFSLNYLTAEDAAKLIAPALSAKGTSAVSTPSAKGLPSGSGGEVGANSFALPDSIIVRDFPENMEQVRAILKQMDRRPRQVLVEATILQVKLDDTTDLGVDFNALAGIDFHQLSSTTTLVTDPTATAANAATTAPVPQPGQGPTRPGAWGQTYTQGFATAGPGLNVGFITNNVAMFIHALETVEDTTVLSNPKVLALNKQRAQVIVGDRIPYVTTTMSDTTAVQTVSFLDVGTELIFRPFISDDGYVRMEIHPKVSSAVLLPPGNLPRETTTEVTANVMVKDGHTIVIGGLFDETATVNRSQVPVLGGIPGIGWLFRSNSDTTERHEIIVLLTPHILDSEEAANDMALQVLDDAKRRCLGLREGFSWITRERIQTAYLQAADKAWQRYQKDGKRWDLTIALWNTQLALNVAPNNLKALRMKDEILSEKRGEPVEPPNWTIWNSLSDRLREMDEEKKESPPPATPPPAALPPPETTPRGPAEGRKPAPPAPAAAPAAPSAEPSQPAPPEKKAPAPATAPKP